MVNILIISYHINTLKQLLKYKSQCLLSTILQIYVSLMLKNKWKDAYQKIQHKDTSRTIQNDHLSFISSKAPRFHVSPPLRKLHSILRIGPF